MIPAEELFAPVPDAEVEVPDATMSEQVVGEGDLFQIPSLGGGEGTSVLVDDDLAHPL